MAQTRIRESVRPQQCGYIIVSTPKQTKQARTMGDVETWEVDAQACTWMRSKGWPVSPTSTPEQGAEVITLRSDKGRGVRVLDIGEGWGSNSQKLRYSGSRRVDVRGQTHTGTKYGTITAEVEHDLAKSNHSYRVDIRVDVTGVHALLAGQCNEPIASKGESLGVDVLGRIRLKRLKWARDTEGEELPPKEGARGNARAAAVSSCGKLKLGPRPGPGCVQRWRGLDRSR